MSLHDAYARLTPYELAFPDRAAVADLLVRVDEEAAGRGADPFDPHAFVTMGAVATVVRALEGPDSEPGAIHQFGALVYHSVHFMRAECPLFVLSTHAARYLVEGAPPGEPRPPSFAGYVQLPQHLFWAAASDGARPESVDGMFWTATPAGVLHVMLATGMRSDRPGLAVVPLPEAPLTDAPTWLDASVRDAGREFASTLPGAEFDGLYSFRSTGEVLKLLGRLFAYVDSTPQSLEAGEPPAGAEAPLPSTLPYTRVTLNG